MAQAREFPLCSHQVPSSRLKKYWKILIILCASASAALYAPPSRAQLQQNLVYSPGGAVAVRNDQTGALSPVSGSPFSSSASSPFTLDVQGRFLFAPGNNSIHMFQITDSTTGAYQEVEPGSPFASTFTNDPVFIGVEPTGNYIAVVNRNGQIAGESSVETFQIQTNPPALVPVANSFLELNSTPIGFSQPLDTKSFYLFLGPSFPSDTTMPLGEELDAVSIDPQSGIPSLQSLANSPDNSTARSFAADPQGRFVVIGRGELVGQILVTGINGSFPSGSFDLGLDVFPSQLFVDSTGSFIYAAYPPAPNPAAAVHIFSLDSSTGMIAETSSSPLPGFTAVPQFSPDPTGPFNYGGDPQPNLAHAFTIDPVTGYFLEAPGSPYTVTGISFPLTFGVPPGQQGISGPSVSLSQSSLSFGSIQTNSSSSPQMVSVQSNGGQALSISSITLSGIDPSQFALSDTCHSPTVIQPGNFCSINLTFAPTAPGLQQATVMITDNAPGSPQSVTLTGTAVAPPPPAPAVTVTPNPVSFPTITQGATSNPIMIAVTNSGNATLNISSVVLGGNNSSDFSMTSGCGGAYPANTGCVIAMTFTPLAAGQRSAIISISDDAQNSPQSIQVSGTATAAPPTKPVVSLSSTNLVFGAITQGAASASQNVTVSNSGGGPLHISSVGLGGASPGDFSMTNGCTASAYAVNASCTISVSFAPLLTGARAASVLLVDDASDSPQTIHLSGTANPAVVVGPAAGGSTTATVAAGQTASYNLQITPGPGYSGTVALAYSGTPLAASIQAPSSLQISNGNATLFTVMVTTSGSAAAPPFYFAPRSMPFSSLRTAPILAAAILLLLWLALGAKRRLTLRPTRFAFSGAFVAIVILLMLGSGGCGGGSTSQAAPQTPQVVTPQGTSTITVTPSATSAGGKPLPLQPIQLTLTVN